MSPAPHPKPDTLEALHPEELRPIVAANIRQARVRAGIGMLQFARQIGVNKETLRRIEAGINLPRLDVAHRIAVALNIHPKELLGLNRDERRNAPAAT